MNIDAARSQPGADRPRRRLPARRALHDPLEALSNLGVYGQPLLPALEALLQQPLKPEELRSIANAIRAMALPAAQEQQLLAKLTKDAR